MLLSTILSNGQTLNQFLVSTDTPHDIITTPQELNKLLVEYELTPLDFTTEEAKKEIKFVQFLYDVTGETFKEEMYWDYQDSLSSQTLEEILDSAIENNTTFQQAAEQYVWENVEWNPEDDNLREFYAGNPGADVDDEFYTEIYHEYITHDLRIDTLLHNSAPEDLTVYFGKSWDDEYSDIEARYNTKGDTTDTPIEWLMKTQGYEPEDLRSEAKRKTSKFLKTLYEELYDYDTDLSGMQLVAIPDSNDFEAILAVARKQGVIKASTTFGLFNRIHGGGSGLSIELEKDIRLDESSPLHDVTLAHRNNSYNYSPDAVYGLVRKKFTGEDLSKD